MTFQEIMNIQFNTAIIVEAVAYIRDFDMYSPKRYYRDDMDNIKTNLIRILNGLNSLKGEMQVTYTNNGCMQCYDSKKSNEIVSVLLKEVNWRKTNAESIIWEKVCKATI